MARNVDRWPELCRLYAHDDQLPTRKAGPWTEDKIYFWNRYISITTTSMCGSPKWPGEVVYADLFAGPGVCRIESTGKRFPGSVLVAAHAPKPFRKIIACERDTAMAQALQHRLAKTPASSSCTVVNADCNAVINQIVDQIPTGSLALAFIDPENLNVPFETVAALANRGRTDLLVLFADSMDIVRNVDLYEKQSKSVLDRMMGASSVWRSKWANLENRSRENICRLFADEYCDVLRRELRYVVFRQEQMLSTKGPLYRLIFASKHRRGADFWDKITKKDRGGQLHFGGD